MNLNGVTAVYISPQLLAPNVPSTEAIAMLLATRPDLNPATAHQPAPAATTTSSEQVQPVSGTHVDLYA